MRMFLQPMRRKTDWLCCCGEADGGLGLGTVVTSDFSGLATATDTYLSDHDKLRGVLIHAKAFPGWEDFK